MSGSTIGGLAGAAVGFFVPGIGPQLGATIGSFLGGIIAPPTIEAPSIGDAQRQSVQPGLPRPKAYAMPPPFAGTIIDGETVARKVTVKNKQGKGGPTVKEEKFYLTTAIGCGEPGEIVWIEYDGVVVLDRRPADTLPEGWEDYSEEVKVAQAKFLENARLYNGDEDQLPDPALEAIHGVGNTPAFRGTSYFVHEDTDRTLTKGTAGQYRVMVASCADIVDVGGFNIADEAGFYYPLQSDYSDVTGTLQDLVPSGDISFAGVGVKTVYPPAGNAQVTQSTGVDGASSWTISLVGQVDDFGGGDNLAGHFHNFTLGDHRWAFSAHGSGFIICSVNGLSGSSVGIAGPVTAPGARFVVTMRRTPDLLEMFQNGTYIGSVFAAGSTISGSGALVVGGAFGTLSRGHLWGIKRALTNAEIRLGSIQVGVPGDIVAVPDSPDTYYDPETGETIQANPHSTAELCDVSLQEIVEDIAYRCNVPADKIDASALAGIFVPGFLLSNQIPGKSALEPLMLAYQFDLPEYDGQIIARLRGGPVEFTITNDQLLLTGTDDETLRPQAMEFPAKVSVVTQEPEANYAAIPQTSIRLTPDVEATGEVVIQLAIPLSADEAMQVAVKVHKTLWSNAEAEAVLSLPPDFATLIASDPIQYDNRRWLVTKTDYADGALRIEAKYERTLNYESTATGTPPTAPTPPGGLIRGPTRLVVANLPSLREQDNEAGVYAFAQGTYSGWVGADIYLSTDGGLTYSLVDTITQPSIMGRLTLDEPSGGEPITVRLWKTTDELENATTAQVAQGKNAAAIIDADDVAEIIGYETATQETSGDWDLYDITRGGLGTVEASHLVDEQFVLLELAHFIPIPAELGGTTLLFKPVTIGTSVDAAPVVELVFDPPVFVLDGGGA